MNNKKVTAFLKGTKNILPRNVQEQVVRRMKYVNVVNDILADGGRYKNLMYHGFSDPQNYESLKNMARAGNAFAKSRVNKHNRARNKVISFLMDNSVTVNKLPLIKKMMRDKKFLVLVNDLKYVKNQNDVNMIQKFRTNSKNMYSRPPVKRNAR